MSTGSNVSTRGRKVRALLAGGLVLGVGAAVTLAAWTDDEWAIGNFGAGTFSIEGSTDGTAFAEHPTEGDAAALEFELAAENLSPQDVVAAPFAMRTTAETTYGATVSLAGTAATEEIAPDLTYGIIEVDSAEACAPDATGSAIVPAGTALGEIAGASEISLPAGSEGSAGDAAVLCIQVTAGDTLAQGDAGTATWEFTADSVE